VARRIELKLSYVTTGQEVPDHIEVGRPDRIARLLLDGGTPR
jgi:flagellar biosynthesis GTPase FlhF